MKNMFRRISLILVFIGFVFAGFGQKFTTLDKFLKDEVQTNKLKGV